MTRPVYMHFFRHLINDFLSRSDTVRVTVRTRDTAVPC